MKNSSLSLMNRKSLGVAIALGTAATVLAPVPQQASALVTGEGTSVFKSYIDWLEWGENGETLDTSAEVVKTSTRQFGTDMSVTTTCTLSGFQSSKGEVYEYTNSRGVDRSVKTDTRGSGLQAYVPGSWRTDGWDDLYGAGQKTGLANSRGTSVISFDVSCTAKLNMNGKETSLPISGLVLSDAESLKGQYGNLDDNVVKTQYIDEFLTLKATNFNNPKDPTVNWRLLDVINNNFRTYPLQNPYFADVTTDSVTLMADNRVEVGAKSSSFYADGVSGARFSMAGSARSAIAIGTVLEFDLGDAPESYGVAAALMKNAFEDGIMEDATYDDISDETPASFDGEGELSNGKTYLGTSYDVDRASKFDPNADADKFDNGLEKVNPIVLSADPGVVQTPLSLDVKCYVEGTVPANVKGWIDLDLNGTFEDNEASAPATCDNGSAKLTFTVDPLTVKNRAKSFARLRISTDETIAATGATSDGEVEDYAVPILVSRNAETTGPQGDTQNAYDKDAGDKGVTVAEMFPGVTEDGLSVTKYQFSNGDTVLTSDQGTYEIDEATGVVTFTPTPTFVGTALPVEVQAVVNGYFNPETKATGEYTLTATYTPTVTKVTPTGEDVTSTGPQGKEQTGTPVFKNGDEGETPLTPSAKNPAKFIDPVTGEATDATTLDAKDASGKVIGSYTLDPATGIVTFKPNPDFYGTPVGVTVQMKDKNGTPATATYTPTVTQVIPTGTGATSVDVQGKAQTGKPVFANGDDAKSALEPSATNPAKLVDPATNQATDALSIDAKDASGNVIGSYTIDPATGVVTFQPNADYVGTPVPATVELKDENGTPARATYQPVVVEAAKAEGATSKDMQGKVQTGTPTFTNNDGTPLTPSAENPAKLIDPATGQVTDATTVDAMGVNPKTGKEEKIGTYTIDPLTGVVTFTPILEFYGTAAPASVQVLDAYGNPVVGKYTPTVLPFVPVGTGVGTSDVQVVSQVGTPKFTNGDGTPLLPSAENPAKLVDPATNLATDALSIPAMKDGVQVGEYTIDPLTGTVTFRPYPDFIGMPEPATVALKDINGTEARASYQPNVTAKPAENKGSSEANIIVPLAVAGAAALALGSAQGSSAPAAQAPAPAPAPAAPAPAAPVAPNAKSIPRGQAAPAQQAAPQPTEKSVPKTLANTGVEHFMALMMVALAFIALGGMTLGLRRKND